MASFTLKIYSCDRVFYDGPCQKFIFSSHDGEMEIMANHVKLTTTVEVGIIRFEIKDGEWQTAVVSDGLLEVASNQVRVIVYSCEKPEEIDEFRAEAAKERAYEQLSEKQSIMQYNISRASLARALARLKSAGKNTN